ncbi:MAG: cytochrome c oxidase subunit 3 [Bacteroidota bacterium]
MVNNITASSILEQEKLELDRKAKRALLWFGIISIVMLFAGLTSAYMVRQGEGKWVQFALPQLFFVSTAVIILSSVTMQWAVVSIKKNKVSNLKTAILLTFLLGIGFVIFQYIAWGDLISQGIYFVGTVKDITSDFTYVPAGNETVAQAADIGNVAASFLYVITGLHVAHLIGGILALSVVLVKSLLGRYSSSNYNGVVVCSIYWHFLDALWIYLFLFLMYIR